VSIYVIEKKCNKTVVWVAMNEKDLLKIVTELASRAGVTIWRETTAAQELDFHLGISPDQLDTKDTDGLNEVSYVVALGKKLGWEKKLWSDYSGKLSLEPISIVDACSNWLSSDGKDVTILKSDSEAIEHLNSIENSGEVLVALRRWLERFELIPSPIADADTIAE
jgi:hypothetical protein